MTLDELRAGHRARIMDLAANRGASNIRVFGSVARDTSTSTSDIDLVVDFEPGRSLLDLTGLQLDLQVELGCKVDVISSRGLKPRMAAEIERDAVPL